MNFNLNDILPMIVAYIPMMVACFGEITAFISTMKQYKAIIAQFNALIADVKSKTDQDEFIEELKRINAEQNAQIVNLLHENAEVKKHFAEFIQKVDKVKTITIKE